MHWKKKKKKKAGDLNYNGTDFMSIPHPFLKKKKT